MTIQQIRESAEYVEKYCKDVPKYGIILGTGLGALAERVDVEEEIHYSKIPHFPVSTVEAHAGKLLVGKLAGKSVIVMQGRFHVYEGYNMQQITLPVRVMKLLGIEQLFISNAAGALDPDFHKSDIMLITDHINLLPENPLRGPNLDELGPRFPDMSEPYDPDLLARARKIAKELSLNVREGVYAAVPGPNLETKAEYRYLRTIGADAVGMSTIPEVIVSVHMGLPVFALSAITDLCTPGNIVKVSVQEILQAAAIAEPKMTALMHRMVAQS